MKSWHDIGFEIEITGDQSPSLRILQPVEAHKERGESMHHSGGACAETLLIYGEPIREVLQRQKQPSFLIVGLGLGYIEMVIARESLLAQKAVARITSYESVPELRHFFHAWLFENRESLQTEVAKTYDLVAEHVLQGTSLNPFEIREFLRGHFPELSSLQGALNSDLSPQRGSSAHCILYDAFSSKTSPHLWEEEFLCEFLRLYAEPAYCVLSTYACRGTLKRALAREGFAVKVREGFQGKRNSTLALRERDEFIKTKV
ncbi:MAG: MnmC family methyltransferase [Bdellovibrio sp.]